MDDKHRNFTEREREILRKKSCRRVVPGTQGLERKRELERVGVGARVRSEEGKGVESERRRRSGDESVSHFSTEIASIFTSEPSNVVGEFPLSAEAYAGGKIYNRRGRKEGEARKSSREESDCRKQLEGMNWCIFFNLPPNAFVRSIAL